MVLHEGGNYDDMISAEPVKTAAPVSSEDSKPDWIHVHPYLATIIGVIGLLFLGTSLFLNRNDVGPAQSSGAWGGAGGMFFGNIKNALPTRIGPEDITRLQSSQDTYAAIPIYTPSENPDSPAGADDLANIFAQLVQKRPVTSSSEVTTPDSYSFIPQGFVSSEPTTKKRTSEQDKLFTYGNQVGIQIKGYEDSHYGSAQILKDHVEDRANPDKIRGLKILGQDMQQLGIDLKNMPDVPESAAGMHRIYANAYYAAGANMILISETSSDEEFVNAITKYNAVIEKLSVQFQLLVALFGANEVTFSSSDPGNVFMFSPTLSLTQ